eukprot:9347557-Pyramimonas_sp.AAC.1
MPPVEPHAAEMRTTYSHFLVTWWSEGCARTWTCLASGAPQNESESARRLFYYSGGDLGGRNTVRVPLIAAVFNSRVPILVASEPTTVAAYPGDFGGIVPGYGGSWREYLVAISGGTKRPPRKWWGPAKARAHSLGAVRDTSMAGRRPLPSTSPCSTCGHATNWAKLD